MLLVAKSVVLLADFFGRHVVVPSGTPKLEPRLNVVLFLIKRFDQRKLHVR